ncbi:MAG: GGDEF domain-containing response regulator [Nitrospirota bacterium]
MARKANILLVQNAQTQGNGTRRHLEAVGYVVIWAGSGISALSVAKQQAVDLIIIDVALPDIEGGDLCRRFRSREATRTVPIILLTGHGYVPLSSNGRDSGPDDHLAKPFSEGELDARITRALKNPRSAGQALIDPLPSSAPAPKAAAAETPTHPPAPALPSVPAITPQRRSDTAPAIARNKDPQVPISPPHAGSHRTADAAPPPEDEVVDAATGLFSRKQFEAMFSKDFKRSVRFKQQLSCMLIDLDGRKMGRAGDEATLKEIIRLLQQTIREVDTAAWWSGEALIVLLPNTIKNDAVQAAMRVLESVANHPFTWADSTKVTMSIGVAGLPDRHIDTEQKLISAAAMACHRSGELMKP